LNKGNRKELTPFDQSRQDNVLKLWSTRRLGKKVLTGVSGRKHQGRLEVDPWGFGARDTEDLRPAILPLKQRFWKHLKEFKLLRKLLVLKHCSF